MHSLVLLLNIHLLPKSKAMQNENYEWIYAFEKLKTWKKSKELVKSVYRATRSFPNYELYGLTSQLRRSALSVASNLAEGSARTTPKDKARFTTISYSSLMEALNQLIIAFELGYVNEKDYQSIRSQIQTVSYMLCRLRDSQLGEEESDG